MNSPQETGDLPLAPRPRRLKARILLALVACLCMLGVAEGVVRWRFPVIHLRREFRPGIYVEDAARFYALKPSYQGIYTQFFADQEVHTTSRGLRGRERELPAADEALRILCLGDSNTFGMGVEDAETYPAQLEAELRARGREACVFNAGVPGYWTLQELRTLELLAPVLRPDVVVVGWLQNDIADPAAPFYAGHQVIGGYVCENAEGYEKLQRDVLEERSWEISRLAQLVSLGSRLWRHERRVPERALEESRPFPPEQLEASFALVQQIYRTARQHGARCLVLVYGTQPEVESGRKNPAVQFLEDRLQQEQMEFLSFTDLLHACHADGQGPLFVLRDETHPNPAGHGITARALADAFEAPPR